MKRIALTATLFALAAQAAAAAPAYEPALAFTRDLVKIVDQGYPEKGDAAKVAARTKDVNALLPRAEALFKSAGVQFARCIEAANWATEYWRGQREIGSKVPDAVAVNALGRAGFNLGETYRQCRIAVEAIEPSAGKAPMRIIDASKPSE